MLLLLVLVGGSGDEIPKPDNMGEVESLEAPGGVVEGISSWWYERELRELEGDGADFLDGEAASCLWNTNSTSSRDTYSCNSTEGEVDDIPFAWPMELVAPETLPDMPDGSAWSGSDLEGWRGAHYRDREPNAASNLPATAIAAIPEQERQVVVTFYLSTGDPMYSGIHPYEGAAACWWGLDLGTRFRLAGDPTNRTYTCLDRGAGPNGQVYRPTSTTGLAPWVDIYFDREVEGWAWQTQIGSRAVLTVEEE